jgi:hypothetical protein
MDGAKENPEQDSGESLIARNKHGRDNRGTEGCIQGQHRDGEPRAKITFQDHLPY